MTATKYLITAATGATGSASIAALLEAGQEVRAFVHREDERSAHLRKQGVETMFGDLNDFKSVKAALQGVNRAYFCFPVAPGLVQATSQFSVAAKEAGVDTIVNMSMKIAREDALSPAAFEHWLAEQVFDWSGLSVTHIRPTFFTEWLFGMAPMIQQGTIYAPYGPGKTAMLTAEDQGRVIATILQNPAPHRGKTYPLDGPVEYTFAEIAGVVGHALGKNIDYQQVPFDVFIGALTADRQGVARNDAQSGYAETNKPDESGESHLSKHLRQAAIDLDNGVFGGKSDFVEQITGFAPMTIQDFVTKHRA